MDVRVGNLVKLVRELEARVKQLEDKAVTPVVKAATKKKA